MNKEKLLFTLDIINKKILDTHNIELDDLKKLLLISYYELTNENEDIVTKSFLITTLYHFIKLEDEYQESLKEQTSFNSDEIIKRFINKRNI